MLFPFAPESPVVERLRFLTDIVPSKDGSEQRLALRVSPRQEFDYLCRVTDAERQLIENGFFSSEAQDIELPLWTEESVITAPASVGDTAVTATYLYSDFRTGDSALVWADDDNFEVVDQIVLTDPTQISFLTLLENDYPAGARIYPIRVCNIINKDVTAARYPVRLTDYSITFSVKDNYALLDDASAFTTYNDLPVLDDPNAMLQDTIAEGWTQQIVTTDGDTGPFTSITFWDRSRRSSVKTFLPKTRQRLWQVRQLLYYLKGRQRSFWLPSFGQDFTIVAPIAAADASLTVVNAGYAAFTQAREPRNVIRLLTTSGTILTRGVVTADTLDPLTEELNMDAVWGVDLTVDQVARIDIMERMRLDVDDVTITHYDNLGNTSINLPVRNVADDIPLAVPDSTGPTPTPPPGTTPPPVPDPGLGAFYPPFPFADDPTADAWYTAWFSANTGNTTSEGSLTVVPGFRATDNTVYHGLYVQGSIDVSNTTNVEIYDCVIDGITSPSLPSYGVSTKYGPAHNLFVHDCVIRNIASAGVYVGGFRGDEARISGIEVHHSGGDGFKSMPNVRFQNVWGHHLGYNAPLAHADMFQFIGVGNIGIDTAYADMPRTVANTHSNTLFQLQGGVTEVTARRCVHIGGNWYIHNDAISFDIDLVYHFVGTAQYGGVEFPTNGNVIGRFYDAISGAVIDPTAK